MLIIRGTTKLRDRLRAAPPAADAPVETGDGPGIDPLLADAGLTIAYRDGGERLRPYDGERSRKLKTLMQEAGIVPWMRGRVPLLVAGERLIAVADLWLSADGVADPGYVVRWDDHPALN